MKKLTICGVFVMAVVLLAREEAQAQGTLYVTSLGQPSAEDAPVGSDSWQSVGFSTGPNPGGYALDSVQLEMAPGVGVPNGFSVMLYSTSFNVGPLPGTSLGVLSGPSDPVAGGLYNYTASDLALSPSTPYFIVVNAGTAVAGGAFEWNVASSPPSTMNGWNGGGSDFFTSSSDGASWHAYGLGNPEIGLTATAVPEPDTLVLLGLPGLLFFARRLWYGKASASAAR